MTYPLRAPAAAAERSTFDNPGDVRAVTLALELIRIVSERTQLPAGAFAAANDTTVAQGDRELLQRQLGMSDARSIIARVQGLEAQLTAARATPRAELARAEATIESLTEQLHSLYRERELLERSFGAADAEPLAARVLEREQAYIDQLHDVYREREELASLIGTDSPAEVIRRERETVENLTEQLHTLYEEREREAHPGGAQADRLVDQLHALYVDLAAPHDTPAAETRSALDEIRQRFFRY